MYLFYSPTALRFWLYRLPQWQRERVAEATTALLYQPRPGAAALIRHAPGDTYLLFAGDRRVVYRVYQDDGGADVFVGVQRV